MPYQHGSALNFEAIKDSVRMEHILEHYGVSDRFRKKNEVLFGPSPLNGNGSNGSGRKFDFKAGISGRRWYYYGAQKRGGDVIDFVAEKEETDVWDAANHLSEWFDFGSSEEAGKADTEFGSEEGYDLEPGHESIRFQGIKKRTAQHFGAGYCSEGNMEGRIVIPIHDEKGALAGYAGRRAYDDETDEPLYIFESKSGVGETLDELTDVAGLYNLHRALEAPDYNFSGQVSVVVDVLDVFRLYQHGVENVVAMMGPEARNKQVEELTFCTSLFDNFN
jgi:hypothetical protein